MFYEKATFIYEKNNSLTDELCEYIIGVYNDDCISELHKIKNDKYKKLTQFLKNELFNNLSEYENKINKFEKINMIQIKKDIIEFFIEKNINNNNINHVNRYNHNTFKTKEYIYIWFLNKYDGEIVFWNNYKIIPKVGKFVMFPISWCFSYSELINLQSNKIILYGYLYN
jgi:hypothetical protein